MGDTCLFMIGLHFSGSCEACYNALSNPTNLDAVASPIREAMLNETYATVATMASWEEDGGAMAPAWRVANCGDGSWMQELGPGQLSCMQFTEKAPSADVLRKSIGELIRHQNTMVRSVWALHADPDRTLYKRLAVADHFLEELAVQLASFGPLNEEGGAEGGSGGSMGTVGPSAPPPPPLTPTNDEGNAVSLGTDRASRDIWYCGKRRTIPGTDGRCGPNNGRACASCTRYKESRAQSAVREKVLAASAVEAQTPGAKAKSVLIGFFAKSTLITLVHFLQTTWERAQTRQTPMSLVAAQACESMLEEGLQMLRGLVPASLAAECEKSPLWLKMLSQASVQLQSMCCKGAIAPEVPQTLAMELSIELASQTGSARSLVNAIIGLVDRSRRQHAPSIAAGLDAVCKRMAKLAASAPPAPLSAQPAHVDLDAAAASAAASPNGLLSAAELLLAVLSSVQTRKPEGSPFVLDGSIDELNTVSKLLDLYVSELGPDSILKMEDASLYETAALERGLSAALVLLNNHFKQTPAPSSPPPPPPSASAATSAPPSHSVDDATAVAAADAAEIANTVKDQLLSILNNEGVSAGVYLAALDTIFVGWGRLNGTDSELL